MKAKETAYERFCALMATVAAYRRDGGSVALYEGWKRDFARDCPDATPEQYQHAMRLAARAAGI